jgi:hypothetical protein
LCRKHGVKNPCLYDYRFEGEKVADLEENLRWLKRVKPDTFSWSNLSIHPEPFFMKRRGTVSSKTTSGTGKHHRLLARSLSDIPPAERTAGSPANTTHI